MLGGGGWLTPLAVASSSGMIQYPLWAGWAKGPVWKSVENLASTGT